ncbi:MAG: hypothetical protein EA377_11660 [Phycisphaerales bacterium]|nr:MAG: hypothetical protein EA377_11660 [Phycisphaerales bacterium]
MEATCQPRDFGPWAFFCAQVFNDSVAITGEFAANLWTSRRLRIELDPTEIMTLIRAGSMSKHFHTLRFVCGFGAILGIMRIPRSIGCEHVQKHYNDWQPCQRATGIANFEA